MSANASLTIYRDTACGTALTESLNELVVSERLAPDVALRVLRQFDAVMCETLTHHVRETMSIQGTLDSYNHLDNVWKLDVKSATVTHGGTVRVVDALKVVAFQPQG